MTAHLSVTIGIPGCGKTTWARKLTAISGTMIPPLEIISSDDIREELLGDVNNQERNHDIFKVVNVRVREALLRGATVIVDATNLRPKFRKEFLTIADDYDVVAYAVRFPISENFEVCQKRNLGRERQVPEPVMRRFHQAFLDNCSLDQLFKEGWLAWDVEEPCRSTVPPTAGYSNS